MKDCEGRNDSVLRFKNSLETRFLLLPANETFLNDKVKCMAESSKPLLVLFQTHTVQIKMRGIISL